MSEDTKPYDQQRGLNDTEIRELTNKVVKALDDMWVNMRQIYGFSLPPAPAHMPNIVGDAINRYLSERWLRR